MSASFYILNLFVLNDLRLFLVKYCFFNRSGETIILFVNLLISPCQFLPTAENRWLNQMHGKYMHGGLIVDRCIERVSDEINKQNNLRLEISILFIHMLNFVWQSMHVTNAYVILFLASAKTGDTGICLQHTIKLYLIGTHSNLYILRETFNLTFRVSETIKFAWIMKYKLYVMEWLESYVSLKCVHDCSSTNTFFLSFS